MAPDHLRTIRSFSIFHLPIVSTKEYTMEQVWNIVVACLRRYSSKVSKLRHHAMTLGEFSLGKFPQGFFLGMSKKNSFSCL
jgi:hypothetical protein